MQSGWKDGDTDIRAVNDHHDCLFTEDNDADADAETYDDSDADAAAYGGDEL